MSACATCGTLAERVEADLVAGEALPSAVGQLEAIAGGAARRCPTCRALFIYTYDYEYGAMGDGWETATIERIDRDRVVAVLLESPPSVAVSEALAELGVSDGAAVITTQLIADLDDPAASYTAARKLITAFLCQSDIAAVERLLRHPRAKVRADTLYLLQAHRGSLLFRAVAASTDPSATVRAAATTAAFVEAPRDVGLEPAIIACLHDVAEEVRSNAAWTLAVFAETMRDVSAALPALAERLINDEPKVCTTAARALVGAAKAGADCSGIVSVIERLDPTDELRIKVLDAIHTEASRTRRVHVWRCPTCGSTDAGPNESRSALEFTYMQCNGCRSGGLVDSWQRDSDWSVEIDVPFHSAALPSHVAPLAPGEGFYETMQAAMSPSPLPSPSPSPSPLPQQMPPRQPLPLPPLPPLPSPARQASSVALATGCSRCFGDDTAAAWEALRASGHQSLVSEDRWSVEISSCSCGQRFAVVFAERVDYREGEDDLLWLVLPITPDERAKLARCAKQAVPDVLEAFGGSRRFLVRNQVGGTVDAWWRQDGFSLPPSITTSGVPAPETVTRDTPTSWLLDPDEVAELWALGVPLEAACVPDELLRPAIASRRVQRAWSYGSMGTQETYWALAERTDDFAEVCRDGVVVPPGQTAHETAYEDRADDRDVHGVLWAPFFRDQRAALAKTIPAERRPLVVDAYARILADLEERWAKGLKKIERAPFVEWLRTNGPVDEDYIERWLVLHDKRSVSHLVQGIRARWVTRDVATAFDSVMTSVERFKADHDLQRATRSELLRTAARLVRAP